MSFIFGFIAAIVIIAVVGAIFMNRMGRFFFLRNKGRLSFEDTLRTIRENTGMMGFFSSGVVKEVMGKEVSIGLNEILEGAI